MSPQATTQTTIRGGTRGVDISPGSVRTARLDAGLSLAQVADGHVTRGAIHQIETGRVRPSKATLRHIARRTGKPLSFFGFAGRDGRSLGPATEFEVELAELQDLVAAERFTEAEATARSVLKAQPALETEALVRYHLALCLLTREDALEAGAEAELGQAAAEAVGAELLAILCLAATGAAMSKLQDPRDLSLLEDCLERLATLPTPAPEIVARVEAHRGTAFIHRRRWQDAVDAHGRALELATPVRDLRLMTTTYNDLSIAFEELGEPAKALAHAHRALAVAEMRRDRAAQARIENNIGMILLRMARTEEARERLLSALETCSAEDLLIGRSYVLLSLAELEFACANFEATRAWASDAKKLAATLGEGLSLASAHEWSGLALEQLGRPVAAERELRKAIAVLAGARSTNRLVDLHTTLGDHLMRRGQVEKAARVWREGISLASAELHGHAKWPVRENIAAAQPG